jgi:hypothetical protein
MQKLILVSFFLLGIVLYVLAVQTTFNLSVNSESLIIRNTLTILAAPFAVVLGYETVVLIGGMASLRLAEFMSRVTNSRQIIVVNTEKRQTLREEIRTEYFMVLMPLLIFVLSMAILWDVHNVQDPRTAIFHPILNWLDVLSKPASIDSVTYSVAAIVPMITLIAIGGLTPALILPYFRKFKITGIDSGPFHTTILSTVFGFVLGTGAILTLIGLVFETLWAGKEPSYYHYVIPVMLGLSIHYTIGAFLGREKSERNITKILDQQFLKRVVQGTVQVENQTKTNI